MPFYRLENLKSYHFNPHLSTAVGPLIEGEFMYFRMVTKRRWAGKSAVLVPVMSFTSRRARLTASGCSRARRCVMPRCVPRRGSKARSQKRAPPTTGAGSKGRGQKAEGGRRKAEGGRRKDLITLLLLLHSSAFILHPYSGRTPESTTSLPMRS